MRVLREYVFLSISKERDFPFHEMEKRGEEKKKKREEKECVR